MSLKLLDTPIFRLILLTSAIFGLSACVMFGVMYVGVNRFMEQQVDAELRADARLLADSDGASDPARLAVRLRRRIERNNRPGMFYLLENEQGEMLAGDLPPLPVPFQSVYDDLPPPPLPDLTPEHLLRGYGVTLPGGLNLLVARDTYSQDQVSDLMERTFMVGVLLTLIAAVGSGAIVSRRILRRMEEIGRISREIMSGDLGRRIPDGTGDRDFDGLAVSLNEMLGRIEELMDGVRQVTDNIAHDMRTPLTRLRQHLERVRLAGHSVEEYQSAVDIALLETDGLLETFGALLRIAQIEARTPGAGLQPVDLSDLCAMIAETYGPVAETEGHRLVAAVVPNLTIAGDRQLLIQMLVNLVENALQHTAPGTEIRLLLRSGAEGPELCVIDDGAGIPSEERENVLRRFYRVDAARSTQGSGLGLSLAAAIVRYHGAALILGDNDPGLAVRVAFPLRGQ